MSGARGAFVGRTGEAAILDDAIAAARAGRSAVVLVSGEPGVGKTRLAERACERARAEGMRVAWARAWDGPGAPPFHLFRELLRPPFAEFPQSIASGAPEEARFGELQAIVDAIAHAAMAAPCVIVLDDLHDADQASLLALKLLARQARSIPCCVVATMRPAEAHGDDAAEWTRALLVDVAREATVIELAGLEEEDVERVLSARLGDAAPGLAHRLHHATGGNALFVTAIADLLASEPYVAGAPLPLPVTVRETIRRRLDRLARSHRDVLAAAALLGREVDARALARVVGDEHDVAAALAAGRTEGLLRDGARPSFVHDLVREALEASLSRARRVELHLAAAEEVASIEERARHLSSATPSAPDAIAANARAGENALARGAYADAARAFERALEGAVAGSCDERTRAGLLAALGEALVRAGQIAPGRARCDDARARAHARGDADILARAALGWAASTLIGRVDAGAVERLEEAHQALAHEAKEHALRLRVAARLAAASQPAPDPTRPLALARTAIAEARTTGDRALLLHVLHTARAAFRPLDDLGERTTMDREAALLAETLSDDVLAAHAHGRLLYDAVEAAEGARAAVELATYERLSARCGVPSHRVNVALARSMFAQLRADFAASGAHVDAARAIARDWAGVGDAASELIALHQVFAAAQRGDAASVGAHLSALPESARGLFTLHAQALLGDATAVAAPYRRMIALGVDERAPFLLRVGLALACVVLGDRPQAAALERLLSPFSERIVVWPFIGACQGPVARLLARLAALQGDGARAARMDALADRLHARLLGEARDAQAAPSLQAKAAIAFERDGDTWVVTLGRERVRASESDGLRYLAELVARAGEEVHVTELASAVRGGDVRTAPLAALDASAKRAYRERRAELTAELAEAEERNDVGAVAKARRELEFFERELSTAVGAFGRDRPVGSSVERARVNVTMRIRKAIAKLGERAPGIGHHLQTCVRTGTFCSYRPPPSAG